MTLSRLFRAQLVLAAFMLFLSAAPSTAAKPLPSTTAAKAGHATTAATPVPSSNGAKPVPSAGSTSVTWSGNGTYVDGEVRALSSEQCDVENTPYLQWTLAGSKASSATITLPDSATPQTMVKSNGDARGFGALKLTWTPEGAITLGTKDGVPTVNGEVVTATYVDGQNHAVLTIGAGCLGNAALLAIGDTGSGGGTIFYVSASPFTSTGSPCNTNCHYLEFAPKGWASIALWPYDVSYNGQILSQRTDANIDPILVWSDASFANQAASATAVGTAIGMGMTNTMQMAAATDASATGGSAGVASRSLRFSFAAALAYAGTGTTAGQWFLPSFDELNELCKFARGQTVDLGTPAQCSKTIGALNPSLGFTDYQVYWSSTYDLYDYINSLHYPGQSRGYCFTSCANGPYIADSQYNGFYSSFGLPVRPIRAS